MASQYVYQYTFDLSYVENNKAYKMQTEQIRYCMIDYDFENNFSPIAYLAINLDLDTYKKMKENEGKGKVLLIINKYLSNVTSGAEELYIKKQLTYYFPNSTIDMENIDDNENYNQTKANNMAYKSTYIGLIDRSAITRNKVNINNVFKNTTVEAIVHKYTHFNLIKEPFDANPTIKSLIINPTNSVPELLKYINARYCFYTSNFRYFNDYGYNCLISNKGIGIDIKDGTYKSIIINITSQTNDKSDSNMDGLIVSPNQKLYMIQVNSNEFNIRNTNTEGKVNIIEGVGTNGKKVDSNINYSSGGSGTKTKTIRVAGDNTAYANIVSSDIESSNIVINISKSNVDNSILVPYKEYRFGLPDEYASYGGKYILASKKEMYYKTDGQKFRSVVLATFKKAVF